MVLQTTGNRLLRAVHHKTSAKILRELVFQIFKESKNWLSLREIDMVGQSPGILRRLPKIIRPTGIDSYLFSIRQFQIKIGMSAQSHFNQVTFVTEEGAISERNCYRTFVVGS